MLITDWSGIAFEYAFGTERPVLFIDTPRKVNNPDYEDLDIEPLIVKLRNKIGRSVSPHTLQMVPGMITQLLKEQKTFKEKITAYRDTYIYHWGKSAQRCADYIISLCSSSS
jgi:YidC/Oxa1 family membrane protein insertase